MADITKDSQIKKAIKDTAPNVTSYHPITGYTGLRIRIRDNYVEFQHRYSHPITKKRVQMTLGDYNKGFSLEQARQAHRDNTALLAQRIDPKTQRDQEVMRQALALSNTFAAVAADWLAEQINNTKKPPSASTLESWQSYLKTLNDTFGAYPIADITPPQLVKLFKDIQKEHIHKGQRVKGLANRIFAHAVALGLTNHNPIAGLKGADVLQTNQTEHRPALHQPQDYALLLKDIDGLPADRLHRKAILQLLALTFARIGDLCAMRWVDVDFDSDLWTFKPQKVGGRDDMMTSVCLPLAPQTIDILKRVHELTCGMEYVFYTGRKAAPYADPQQINKILNSPKMNKAGIGKDYCGRGYMGVHCPHGFRAAAKTMLMERLGYDELLTELQLGHRMLNKYGKAYSRMDFIEQRKQMAKDWANYLDALTAGTVDNVIYLEQAAARKQANG